jgi:hypothetical protein
MIFTPALESPSRVRRRPPTLPRYLSPLPESAPKTPPRGAPRRKHNLALAISAAIAVVAAVLVIASLAPFSDKPDAAMPLPQPFSPRWADTPGTEPVPKDTGTDAAPDDDASTIAAADEAAPAPELAAGDPDRLAPDPEARQISMTPQLFELGDTERALSRAMQQKGLIAGDIAELDREMKKIAGLRRGRKYAEALQAGRRALSLVERFELDEDFLKKKNARFNREFDRAGEAAAGDAELARVARDILTAIGEKRYFDANLLLNKAFRIVSRHASRR